MLVRLFGLDCDTDFSVVVQFLLLHVLLLHNITNILCVDVTFAVTEGFVMYLFIVGAGVQCLLMQIVTVV